MQCKNLVVKKKNRSNSENLICLSFCVLLLYLSEIILKQVHCPSFNILGFLTLNWNVFFYRKQNMMQMYCNTLLDVTALHIHYEQFLVYISNCSNASVFMYLNFELLS